MDSRVPVFVRNTFLEIDTGCYPSLEGFYQERQAFSCPSSCVAQSMSVTSATYCPGQLLAKSAALQVTPEKETKSECSTADTYQSTPPSPPPEATSGPSNTSCMPVQVLRLEDALSEPMLGSPQLPSKGSAEHHVRRCKPCAFANTKGCSSGVDCRFCHLCEPGEKKRRQKQKRAAYKILAQTMKPMPRQRAGDGHQD